jgi:hypothetical protein
MAHPTPQGTDKVVWAYAYQIDPPRPESQLGDLRHLLEREQASARLDIHTWQARLVVEDHVTHILVVSDTPAQDRHINRSVERELKRVNAAFSVTVPLAIADAPAPDDDDSLVTP